MINNLEHLLQQIVDSLKSLGSEFVVTIVAMIPIFELRGAIPVGFSLGLPWYKTFIFVLLGNMIPIPFILLFIQKIFVLLRRLNFFDRLINKIEKRALKKSHKVNKYKYFGLTIFVSIPLPVTGAWSGALIATLLEMKFKDAFLHILLGVFIADVIVTGAVYGFFKFLAFVA